MGIKEPFEGEQIERVSVKWGSNTVAMRSHNVLMAEREANETEKVETGREKAREKALHPQAGKQSA